MSIKEEIEFLKGMKKQVLLARTKQEDSILDVLGAAGITVKYPDFIYIGDCYFVLGKEHMPAAAGLGDMFEVIMPSNTTIVGNCSGADAKAELLRYLRYLRYPTAALLFASGIILRKEQARILAPPGSGMSVYKTRTSFDIFVRVLEL